MSDDTPPDTGATASSRGGLAALAAPERHERLRSLGREASSCTRCPQLVAGRTQVVFGAGDPDADLMFVGEAPGTREDAVGIPIAGSPGKLLDELLASIGLRRDQVYLVYVLACRPPGNRDPAPTELSRCRPYLEEQVALVEPRVVCTLGDFATKLLRPGGAGIKQRHGQTEVVEIGRRAVHLLPLFSPAAALYTRALRTALEGDVLRLTELLARPAPRQPEREESVDDEPVVAASPSGTATPNEVAPETAPVEPQPPEPEAPDGPQLGLF
ncbi:MAG: uracil-DNA glycosylase [Solirubrobacteraceae bacterium]|nr:uracil-DNA glycosylase [Solirubrobacteraceae bacterium]